MPPDVFDPEDFPTVRAGNAEQRHRPVGRLIQIGDGQTSGWETTPQVPNGPDQALPADLRLQQGSPALNGGQTIPADWPDPLRDGDKGAPDIGTLPDGSEAWGVGVDGRLSVFGGMKAAK